MSLEHLSVGSTCPPLVPDKLRIYAMRFCPYAQRALLVSAAKNIPTDVVYINLKDKPEWIFERSQAGKVPTVERHDGKAICESLIVCDYMDEAYPGIKLHPEDPFRKAVDRILVENFGSGKLSVNFYKMIFIPSTSMDEISSLAQEYEDCVAIFSKEFEKRGTNYFAGNDRPGMVDYMLWPWFERRPVIELAYPKLNFADMKKNCKAIEAWVDRMKEDPVVKQHYLTPEIHHQYNQTARSGNPDFNMLMKSPTPLYTIKMVDDKGLPLTCTPELLKNKVRNFQTQYKAALKWENHIVLLF